MNVGAILATAAAADYWRCGQQVNQMLPAIWFIMSRRDCDVAAISANMVLVNQQEEAELLDELQAL